MDRDLLAKIQMEKTMRKGADTGPSHGLSFVRPVPQLISEPVQDRAYGKEPGDRREDLCDCSWMISYLSEQDSAIKAGGNMETGW